MPHINSFQQFGVSISINSFQLIGGILKAPDRCRQRELEHFPLWLYLVKVYHADSQIIVGTIVHRLMGKVLGDDPVGIVFAGNSMGNIHSIQDMDSQVYGLVARLGELVIFSCKRLI